MGFCLAVVYICELKPLRENLKELVSYLDVRKHQKEHSQQSMQSSLYHITCPNVLCQLLVRSYDIFSNEIVAIHELDVSGNSQNQCFGHIKHAMCSSSENNKCYFTKFGGEGETSPQQDHI